MSASAPLSLNHWNYVLLQGKRTPGSIPRGGLRGFLRETGWDERRGKGTDGATLTRTAAPPVKGSIELDLIGTGGFYADGRPSTDVPDYEAFVSDILAPAQPAKAGAEGLSIFHPSFVSIRLTDVVVAHYSAPEHMGKGLYRARIDVIEWTPPPAVSIVSTVSSTKPDAPAPDAVPQRDPRVTALQAQIAAASQANQP